MNSRLIKSVCALPAALLAVLLPGCAPPGPGESESASSVRREVPGTPPTGGDSGPALKGRVVFPSDVMFQRGRPATAGYVLVVPDAVVEDFWRSQGLPGSTEGEVGQLPLNAAAFPDGVVASPIDADGWFDADIRGAALLCVTDVYGLEPRAPAQPQRIQGGCVQRPADASDVRIEIQDVARLKVVERE